MSSLTFAQISDCHLYADESALHLGTNVYQNLVRVLADVNQQDNVDFVVFSGDLSQDHSDLSYQLFVQAWQNSGLSLPLVYLPGNHDDPALLQRYLSPLSALPANSDFQLTSYQQGTGKLAQLLTGAHWQLLLMDSQSDSPAGLFPTEQFQQMKADFDNSKQQLLFMHHQPVNVGYFIDQHGLTNQADFWQAVNATDNLSAIACGHIHRGLTLEAANQACSQTSDGGKTIDLYTCPATSVQFQPHPDELKATADGPGYRLFRLTASGGIDSRVVMLAADEQPGLLEGHDE